MPCRATARPTSSVVTVSTDDGEAGCDGNVLARIARRETGLLLFGMTPPRRSSTSEDRQRIADVTLERLMELHLDGLVLYDIANEADRNTHERPFPYLPTVDPADFYADHPAASTKPVVVYRWVGKYPSADIESWLRAQHPANVASVFVGAPSRSA